MNSTEKRTPALPHVITVAFTADVVDREAAASFVAALANQARTAYFGPASLAQGITMVSAEVDQAALAAHTTKVLSDLHRATAAAQAILTEQNSTDSETVSA
jgi:hypothetical protein